MINKAILFSLFIVFSSIYNCFAQNDTTYYNGRWKSCAANDAVASCIFLNKSGDSYHAQCYFKNQQSLHNPIFFYKTLDSSYANGHVDYMTEYGVKSFEGYFNNGRPTGLWKYYYDSSTTVWRTENYTDTSKMELTSYYKSGKVKRQAIEDVYNPQKSIGKCYDERGKEIKYTPFMTFPHPPYDIQKYLARNMRYPAEARRNGEQGRVLVRFIVTARGNITNIEVVRPLSPSLDAAAVSVVTNMDQWEPGTIDDKQSDIPFTLPLTFKLE